MSKKKSPAEFLSQQDKIFIEKIYNNKTISWDERIDILKNKYSKSERTIRLWFVHLGLKNKREEESPQYLEAQRRKWNKEKKRFIITWAQNNTPVHEDFFNNLKIYADFIDADIHVIAGRYKNPTSVFTDKNYDTWHSSLTPYLDANRHDIHKYVCILSDIKVQPTAINPLEGLNGISGQKSGIVGSPKLHLQASAVLEGYVPKLMLTTGSCTVKNYTDSKAGKKSEFNHQLGFCIIEIKDKDIFFPRQVSADDKTGDFCDLCWKVSKGNVEKITKITDITLGDIHAGQEDVQIIDITLKFLKHIKPDFVVFHDIKDGYSISHHELNNPFKLYQREQDGTNSLKREIDYMLKFLEKFKQYKCVIVRSNHDDFIDRWLMNSNWKNNIKNAKEYMQYALLLLEGKAKKGIVPYLINQKFPHFITLGRNDSFKVNGWELSQHGDIGSNGARGSLEGFRKLNTKIKIGHSHTPGRKDGVIQVGTSTKLRHDEYIKGASSHMNAHSITHENGKAQHLIFFNGEFTTLLKF